MSDLEVVPFFEESYIKMSMYDTANLVNDVFFETEIFPDVFWVPYSTLGKSEIIFTEDKIKSLKKTQFKGTIHNPYEFIQYLQSVDFTERMDIEFIDYDGIRWAVLSSGLKALQRNYGTCTSISGAFYYVLHEYYNSMGILCMYANSGVGHTVNYIERDGFLYFMDPYVQMNKYVSDIPKETGLKRDFARTKYVTGICVKTHSIESFISFFERYNILKKREFLYFTYASDTYPPISVQSSEGYTSLTFPSNYDMRIYPYRGSKITYCFKEMHL